MLLALSSRGCTDQQPTAVVQLLPVSLPACIAVLPVLCQLTSRRASARTTTVALQGKTSGGQEKNQHQTNHLLLTQLAGPSTHWHPGLG